jgi:fibronectin type 3 domain-containing protein
MRPSWLVVPGFVLAAACTETQYVGGGGLVAPPADLIYTVEASGTPDAPSGVLLQWDLDDNPNLAAWHVYSRGSTSESYRLRATTTSNSFHDEGFPHLQYYVTAEDIDGAESSPSNVVTVDERLALEKPTTLTSTTLDGAIALVWSDNAYLSNPSRFTIYRVYSASYDLDMNLCGETWSLEGTTVAPEFVASALTNGVSRCFGVSAVSREGWESLWSPLRNDTPRPDARNVVLYARQVQDAGSGFRFWRDVNSNGLAEPAEIGLVLSGSSALNDFSVERDGTGALFLTPVRAGTGVVLYGNAPIFDLTSIDVAPVGPYSTSAIEALPGWGYVFETDGGDDFARYGGVRVTHAGQNFLILDWSFQTDFGNPELIREASMR